MNLDLETIIPLLIGVWRRLHKEGGPSDSLQTREFRKVVEGVKYLLQKLEDPSHLEEDYFNNPDLIGAYLLYQWVIHYQEGMSLMGELPHPPRRVLDICSGPAPFAFAALKHGTKEVIATDRNLDILRLGGEICGRYGFPLTVRQWNCVNKSLPFIGEFDLIILGHCLRELFPETMKQWKERQADFIQTLLSCLSADGYLLLIDSSQIHANRRLLTLRDELVSQGVPVQAPCVWKGNCPALQTNNSPCYAQRNLEKPYLIKEIQRAAKINLGSLKMTYLLFRSPKAQWPHLQLTPLYRVISPPVDTYQGKRFYLCGTDGKKMLGSHLEEHPAASRAFSYLKRGELIEIKEGLERNHAIDIIKGTQVSVKAACGKPVPEDNP